MSSLHSQKEWALKTTLSLFYIKGRLGWKGLRASEFIEEGPFLVTGTDFEDGKVNYGKSFRISMERYLESPEIALKEDDILITKDGTIGKVAYIDHVPSPGMASLNSHLFLVRSKTQGTSPRYCYYVFQSEQFRAFIESKKSGSTLAGLPQRVFEQFEIPLPQFGVQSKIAKILSTVDNLIQKTQALIDKYQSIKQGMIHDLFTRGVDEHGQLRPDYDEAPHLYKKSELGWIPKEWEVVSLMSLLAEVPYPIRSGPFGSSLLKAELVESGIPLLGIDNVYRERFCKEFKRFVSPSKFHELIQYRVRPHDVMITIMGTVGRACMVPEDIGEALSSKHVWTMTLDESKYDPNLLCWQLNYGDWVLSWFRRDGQGAVMDSITSSTLKNTLIPRPPLSEQETMKFRYQTSSNLINDEIKYCKKLQLLKCGLMQDLLTGKVRAKVDSNEECVA